MRRGLYERYKSNQVRTVDLAGGGAKFIEKAPADIVETCNDYLHRLTDDVHST